MKHITLKVPASVLGTAKRVAQAFDPDVGGYDSFEPVDEEGMHVCSVDVSKEYAMAFPVFKTSPAILQQSIAQDFSRRFPTSPIPSLSECTAFCKLLVINEVE